MKKTRGNKNIKNLVSLTLILCLILPLGTSFSFAAPAAPSVSNVLSPFGQYLESKYIDPDRVYSTDVRWWLGSASHTDETLLEEIQALYDGGFRGVELCMQSDNAAPNETYAYGSEMWAHKWNLMMNKLLDLGMGVYLTSGTNWATSNVPGLDPDSQSAMQNASLGTSTVDAGAILTVLPTPNTRRPVAKFIGAYAYLQTANNTVDYDSVIDLTSQVTEGATVWEQELNWIAPADGAYRVFALWTQGTAQSASPSTVPSYATNYFDVRGVQALKEFWLDHYLSDPVLNQKILDGDVQLFMDSLEIGAGGGFTYWAEDMADEFEARKGYDIRPYLFLLSGVNASVTSPYHSLNGTGVEQSNHTGEGTYKLGDSNEILRQKMICDYLDVLTQIYKERMLDELKAWLNSVGIKTRAQISYGRAFEISEPIMSVDYPEAENLNQYGQVDIYRLWTGGAKLQNKVLSSETGAEGIMYNFTHQMHFEDAYSLYAAGFSRIVWHVWGAGYGYGNYAWPGYLPRGDTFHYLGSRHPGSRDYDEFNAHLGRIQQLLQTGKSRTDIGFVHNNWTQGIQFLGDVSNSGQMGNTNLPPNSYVPFDQAPGNIEGMNWKFAHMGVYYRSTELQDNGYTYDYFSPKFLDDPSVTFDPITKTIEPAGYRALVIYQEWLTVEGAQKILAWAKQGLPVIILGDAASRTPFYKDDGDADDAALAIIMADLKDEATVREATVADYEDYFQAKAVGYEDNVMELLQEMGVYPYAQYSEPNKQLLTQSRVDESGNQYLYVYNYCPNDYHYRSHLDGIKDLDHSTNIKTEIEMDGMFIPYSIDAFSGKVTELANYRYEGGSTIFSIDLDFLNIALFAFEKVNSQPLHIVESNAESAYAVPGNLVVRATGSGAYNTVLSNGVSCQINITAPASFDITNWDVTVESWTANPTEGDLTRTETIGNVTTTNRKTSTVKTPINVALPTLTTWNNIPEVGKDVSGAGFYKATFNWDASIADGAYLDFGNTLQESMEVWINGKKVGGDVSMNPTKVKKSVGVSIDGVIPEGNELFTGGVSWTKPFVDIGPYLADGENEIVIDYSSALANVQLARGIITEQIPYTNSYRGVTWWGHNQVYLDHGPSQAVLIPYVDTKLIHTLTVTNGNGGGSYVIGETVTVTAGAAPAGQQFSEWAATGMELTEEQAGQNPFAFAMPDGDASFTALYSPVAATPAPPPKGNYGGSQGKVVPEVAPTPTPTPSDALGEESGVAPDGESDREPGGEPAPTPTQPSQPSRPQSLMADIAPDYWAVEFIDGLVARGIVDGYPMPDGSREYLPENDITRLEMAKLIVASLELELIYDYDGSDTFADWFDVQEWGRPYMAAAIEAGIVLGSAEGDGLYLFPDDNIIREEMIAMSVRALGVEVPEGGECDAPDFDAVSEWAMDDVAFAVENEMINLRQGNVAPGSNATRAESAMILYKLLEYLGI